jgi:two-component system chemotaxis response regulator CheY
MALDKNMNILVVDDFSTMRRIITNVLRQLGFDNISEAEDGAKALHILEGETFDFVITDWNMPEMSGLDLIKAIRASDNEQLKAVPVLMVTAEALQDNIIAAAKAGVNNYIIKPFDAQTLGDKINKIFAA